MKRDAAELLPLQLEEYIAKQKYVEKLYDVIDLNAVLASNTEIILDIRKP